MRKFISLALLVLVGMVVTLACKKKVPQTTNPSPLTIIVMDTTQALLPDAQVQIGKQTFTTSFDGRVVLKPEQFSGCKSFTVSCEGFKSKSVTPDGNTTVVVALTPKSGKSGKIGSGDVRAYGHARSGKTAMPLAYAKSADEDGLVEAEYEADYIMDREAAPMASMHTEYAGSKPVANNIKAGKLTAGEVNDFSKWYFWPTLLDSTHKAFIADWKLEPRLRYTVQVKNAAGYPIVNYPVQLTDGQGNTVFQALTDNTGKAELWGALTVKSQESRDKSFFINGKKAEAWQTIVVDDPCEAPEGVDVMFVFDATGSMGDELRYMQAEMKDVIARAKDATDGLKIRTGAVVYRDHGDEYITRISRLTENIKTTQTFIDKQEANGGGDFPEAVPEALMAALNSAGWDDNARARIAFLILDAPCHQDSMSVALLHEQILNAAAQGIRIVPVVCSGLDKSGEYLMRAIALATNGTSFFLTDDSGIGHTHLKPTTDSLKVEHLNDMLVRTIVEFSKMPECKLIEETEELTEDEQFLPNPFNAKDLESDPTIPHGEGVHYLIDVSGKLIGIFEGEIDQLPITNYQLPIGVYFIKTYIDGTWFTKKILVR